MLIRSGQGDYEIEYVEVCDLVIPEGAYCLVDSKVALPDGLLAGRPTLPIHAKEANKTFEGVGNILRWLQEVGATKQSTLVAIGGGIVQDLATFTAHVYCRGIKWIYVPTTLLSQCDSCIGAKCGINLGIFKNQLGCFHAPSRVLICLDFLETLSDEDICSGYGEILKFALIHSWDAFRSLDWARADLTLRESSCRSPLFLQGLITDSLMRKQSIIEQDEYDQGRRLVLNFGHTFGHAFEAVSNNTIPHGYAVAWGIDMANYVAMRLRMVGHDDLCAVHAFVRRHFGDHSPRGLDAGAVMGAIRRDKKVCGEAIDLVLMRKPGDVVVERTPLSTLEPLVKDYLDANSH